MISTRRANLVSLLVILLISLLWSAVQSDTPGWMLARLLINTLLWGAAVRVTRPRHPRPPRP